MQLQKFSFLIPVFLFLSVSIHAQIKKEELMKTVEFLANKELAGRLSGSDGYTKAANFMAGELAKLKIKPFGDENYFQKLRVEYNEILAPEHFSIIKDGKTINYKIGDDYVYRGFTGAGKFIAPVVFCGYGLSQPDLGYDDYSGTDVKGKVVLAFKYNPKWNIDGKNFTKGNPREKAIVAANHGAVGILFVSFPNDAEPQAPIGSVIHGEGEQMINFPEIHINLPAADEIFSESSYTLKDLQTLIDSTKKPYSLPLDSKVDIEIHTKYEKEKEVVNVVGMIEGNDPELKNEYLIVGAHLDHVGSQACLVSDDSERASKIYFPGANDNASGSAALLQIAREFSRTQEKPALPKQKRGKPTLPKQKRGKPTLPKQKRGKPASAKPQQGEPKRSIIFVFFASEEQGLYGSKYFSEHMKFSKEKVKAMINLDCVGYGDSIQIGGGESAPALWNIAKQIDNENDKLLVTRTWKGGGADAEPFFEKGIQTLYFVTTNSYKHLHMLSDKPETLNQNLFEAITRLAFLTSLRIAE